MKRLLLLALLVSSAALAQEPFQMARPAGTPQISGTPGVSTKAAVDKYGNQQVVVVAPGGTGASPVAVEDAVAGSGFAGIPALGIVDNGVTAAKAASGDYTGFAVSDAGTTVSALVLDPSITFAKQAVKAEDGVAASGDALVGVATVRSDASAGVIPQLAANGDYQVLATNQIGGVRAEIWYDSSLSGVYTPFVGEDVGKGNGDVLVKTGTTTNSALAADSATNGDWTYTKGDELGRTITTLAPAGETFAECSATVTDTTTTAIKAAVASNRIYVTHLTCTNNSAVTSLVDIFDGSTLLVRGILGANTLANSGWSTTFPIPLRGTANTAFRFAMLTTATSTRCCISGYISVN